MNSVELILTIAKKNSDTKLNLSQFWQFYFKDVSDSITSDI